MLREGLNSIISLAGMSTISTQCACTDESSMNFEPIIAQTTPLDAGQLQLLELTTAMATFSLCSDVESTTRLLTKNRPRLSLGSRLGGTWPAEQASQTALRFVPFI